jgi:Prokaryotic membrane lipoprotein lipid attachment site
METLEESLQNLFKQSEHSINLGIEGEVQMRKILLTAVAVLALSGSANARANRVPGDVIGWVKSADLDCVSTGDCILVDNYTDAHKHGALCAVWGLPVYSRPNGKAHRCTG